MPEIVTAGWDSYGVTPASRTCDPDRAEILAATVRAL
jgi:hypothetical protein